MQPSTFAVGVRRKVVENGRRHLARLAQRERTLLSLVACERRELLGAERPLAGEAEHRRLSQGF